MSTTKKILLTAFTFIVLFVMVNLINVYAQTIRTLDGVKKSYLESLQFKENPKKLQQFKRSVYYKKMMRAKTSDSVRYYYGQFIKQPEP